MSELLLPIGSVVQLREAEKPVMIFGVYQQRVTDGRNFDYIGEAYPEGFLGGQSNLLFDAEDIAEVLFTGYQTPEYESLMTRAAAHFAQETGEESEEDEEDEAALPTFEYFELARQAKIQEYQAIVDFTNEQLSSISIATAQKKADARQMIQEIEAEIQRLSALKDTADAAYQQLEGGMGGR